MTLVVERNLKNPTLTLKQFGENTFFYQDHFYE